MTVKKPWGEEEILYKQYDFQVKLLKIKEGHRFSLQQHTYKVEDMALIEGEAEIECGPFKIDVFLKPKKMEFMQWHKIKPHFIHRVKAVTSAHILEVSKGEDSDIHRLEDDYGRV